MVISRSALNFRTFRVPGLLSGYCPDHVIADANNAGRWQELDVVENYGSSEKGIFSTIHTTDPAPPPYDGRGTTRIKATRSTRFWSMERRSAGSRRHDQAYFNLPPLRAAA
jgi:hypothetical protein